MPLPKITYKVDQYHNGRFVVVKLSNGEPVEEMGAYWDVEEAKKECLSLIRNQQAAVLFPGEGIELSDLVADTRAYYVRLLELLPVNSPDLGLALTKLRESFAFARTAILLDGQL